MTDDRLTEQLVEKLLGWKVAPGRFIKPDRGWTPTWKFTPLVNLEHAFNLLDHANANYIVSAGSRGEGITAKVMVGARVGSACGVLKARTITLALARAVGLEIPADNLKPNPTQAARSNSGPRSRLRNG
jgi:hypothetical protein